jgi:hypothetical protein
LKQIYLKDIGAFIKNPNTGIKYDIDSVPSFLKIAFKSFLVMLLIDFLIEAFLASPLRYFNLYPSIKEFTGTPITIIKLAIVFPIIEELIFRLPLRISKINVAISFSLSVLFISKWVVGNIYYSIFFSMLLFMALCLFIKNESRLIKTLSIIVDANFSHFFYLQAIIFGFLHLTNYNLDYRFFYLFPLFIASYLFVGVFFGYLRIRYKHGIFLCIASHIIVNTIYCFVIF